LVRHYYEYNVQFLLHSNMMIDCCNEVLFNLLLYYMTWICRERYIRFECKYQMLPFRFIFIFSCIYFISPKYHWLKTPFFTLTYWICFYSSNTIIIEESLMKNHWFKPFIVNIVINQYIYHSFFLLFYFSNLFQVTFFLFYFISHSFIIYFLIH